MVLACLQLYLAERATKVKIDSIQMDSLNEVRF